MNRTKIEWVFNPDGSRPGYTWNPITGCLNHENGICKGGGFPCYAYTLAHGRLRHNYLANADIPTTNTNEMVEYEMAEHDPFYPRFWIERLYDPVRFLWYNPTLYYQKPKGILVCDMGELFGDWVPRGWQEEIFSVIKEWPHRYYLLTKQPRNLVKFSPFPNNCWVGVTATNNEHYVNAIRALDNIEAKVKYISFEPLLGPINVRRADLLQTVHWVIIGAQTKPYKPPQEAWVRDIVEQADEAGIAIFLKNNLMPMFKAEASTERKDWTGQLRQEVPEWL